MTAQQIQAINIPVALVQLRNIFRQYRKDFGDSFLFNAEMSQLLREKPKPQEINLEPLPVLRTDDHGDSIETVLSRKATQHKACDYVNPQALTKSQGFMFDRSQEEFRDGRQIADIQLDALKEKLLGNKQEAIREILATFFDSYDKDLGLLLENSDQFNVPRNVANDLKILFLLLAEEVFHDRELCDSFLMPGVLFDPSETFYHLSEHFNKLGQGETRRR